ncbi:12591_t:CDS:1, partial [Cetraspora pellucida]
SDIDNIKWHIYDMIRSFKHITLTELYPKLELSQFRIETVPDK